MFCQVTLARVLADRIRKAMGVNNDGSRYLVTEEEGQPVIIGLKVTEPRKTEGCQFRDIDCWV